MKDLLIQYFAPIALTSAGGLLTSLTSMVLLKIKNWVDSKTRNENIAWAMERLTHTTETVVADLTQTISESIKADASDGKLTGSDMASLKSIAISTVKTRLKDEIKTYVEMGVNNLDLFIGEKVEQAITRIQPVAIQETIVQEPVIGGLLNRVKSKLGMAVK